METPFIDHLTRQDFDHVYEPAEDSFFLLDALENDLEYLEKLKPLIVLEIGSGSGVIITALATKLRHSLCISTDINEFACRVTKRTAKRNFAVVDAIHCNMLDALRSHTVDVLIFNPPYVATCDEELRSGHILPNSQKAFTKRNLVKAWAGGLSGRRVIDALVACLSTVLTSKGVVYLLLLRENNPDELIERLGEQGLVGVKFKERRIPGEYLYILKITREVK